MSAFPVVYYAWLSSRTSLSLARDTPQPRSIPPTYQLKQHRTAVESTERGAV